MFRSSYAVDFFAALGGAITPLFASDPRQMPFVNAEQQYEDRYVIEAEPAGQPDGNDLNEIGARTGSWSDRSRDQSSFMAELHHHGYAVDNEGHSE